jgi:hypothetical protein
MAESQSDRPKDKDRGGSYLSARKTTHPFTVFVYARLRGAAQVHSIETTDGDGERKLNEVNDRKGEIASSQAKETHRAELVVSVLFERAKIRGYDSDPEALVDVLII